MCDIDVMGYGPAEFYSKFGLKAEKMSQMFRAGLAFDPDGMHHGILKCSETGMCDEAFRSRCIHLANLWDEGGYDNPMVELVYVLDYATPYEVRRQYKRGDVVVLETPEELGFTLPSTHTFKSWTHLGQDITEVTVVDNMVIEGRVERQPGANMLKGTRTWTNGRYSDDDGSVWGWSANTNGVTNNSSAGSTINNGDYYVRRIPTAYNSSRRSCVLIYIPTVSKVVPAGSRLVFSFLYKANTNLVSPVLTDYGIADTHYIDGVKDTTFPKDSETHTIELVLTTTADIPANSTLGVNGSAGFKFYFYQNAGENHDFDFWLPKLEDVTGLPEEEQRATAWVPHVDDVN